MLCIKRKIKKITFHNKSVNDNGHAQALRQFHARIDLPYASLLFCLPCPWRSRETLARQVRKGCCIGVREQSKFKAAADSLKSNFFDARQTKERGREAHLLRRDLSRSALRLQSQAWKGIVDRDCPLLVITLGSQGSTGT
jgi:hypothetical protein